VLLFSMLSLAFLFGCSPDPQAEYDALQGVLHTLNSTVLESRDLELHIKACDEAIDSLSAFLSRYPKGELPTLASNDLASWRSRRSSIERELNLLIEELSVSMQGIAVEHSKKVRPLTNLAGVKLDKRVKSKQGLTITLNDIYSVAMMVTKGQLQLSTVRVQVVGRIHMDTRTVFVDERPVIVR
jgi:hypothetical protein